jgi:hypothetical protein
MVSVTMKGSSSIIGEWMRAGYTTSSGATLSSVYSSGSVRQKATSLRIKESSSLVLTRCSKKYEGWKRKRERGKEAA